jgi:LacI family transcriptional regulator
VVKEYPELKTCHIDTPSGSSGTSESIKKYFANTKKADRVSAFFAFNEPTAIGVLRAIEAEGFKVPKDFSVLSYNDTALATMTNPQLSGIHIPLPQIAEAAVFFLNRCMLKESDMPLKIMVPTTVTERESVENR